MNTPPNPPAPVPHASAPVRHHIEVTASRGGISKAFGFVIGLLIIGGAFFVGAIFGFGGALAAGQLEPQVNEVTWRSGDRSRIVILPVEGIILDNSAEFVRVAVNSILEDTNVRAVVLRVDSPGGAVSPSDRIWRDIQRLRDAGLPVVASYGGVAASGGYYVSCHSDEIIAEPTNITGSIGVIAQVFTFTELMEKLGVEPITMVASQSPQKAVGNDIFRPWDAADRATISRILDAAHATFRDRVIAGRGSVLGGPTGVDGVADGSIFTAEEAAANGLVDSVGYLDDAIAAAESRAGLAAGRATVVRLGSPPSLMDVLFSSRSMPASQVSDLLGDVRGTLAELAVPRAMYLMH